LGTAEKHLDASGIAITVRHTDYPQANPNIPVKGQVWVDSGQTGFFDADQNSGGVICHSGYGDGVYPYYVARDGGKAVAARIVFIDVPRR
jgi:hypothetical protein